MASLLLGPPTDEHGNVKKIPKVAVYVAGAAFAVTTGLTLLVLPFVKQAAKMNHHTQFLSNRNLARPVARALTPAAAPAGQASGGSALPLERDHQPRPADITPTGSTARPGAFAAATADLLPATQRLSGSHSDAPHTHSPIISSTTMTPAPTATSAPSATATLASPPTPLHPQSAPSREKKFNDDEERSLYGALEGEHEYVSPWLGAQALGLATALVMGSAALGMWGVAKVMGVKNMDEFASKMRETLLLNMPALSEALTERPSDEEGDGSGLIPVDHEGVASIDGQRGDGDADGEGGMSWAEVWNEIAQSGEVGDGPKRV